VSVPCLPPHSQPSALPLTNPTDFGTVYSVERIAELAATAKARGMRVHIDGVLLECLSPALAAI
jgi:threonine aldolase